MNASLEQKLLTALYRHRTTAGFYVVPDIPPKKLAAARKSCGIPETDTVLALLDCTVFGSARNCLVVCVGGVYYHNDWAGKSPGNGMVRWPQLMGHRRWDGGFMEISLGGNHYVNVSGCSASKDEVIEILTDVQEALCNVKELRSAVYREPDAVEAQKVSVRCGECGTTMNVLQSLLGGQIVCDKCGARVTV